mmetsp:Transcript_110246/g.235429  ORF Transcript_110246/g.235429 Transcript_110246/m.235429 type:complete len:410 (-) Transcript_110246:293-1522(-)
MELRVETCPGSTLPNGCVISVRLGDILKQRRYDPSGCYQFPAPEFKKNAKIDVYQHIGTCQAVVDPEIMSESEVAMASMDPGGQEMRLRVSATLKPEAAQERGRLTEVKKDAVDYLGKFCIEEHLGKAIKAVLKTRPEDPFDFICSYLKQVPVVSSGDQVRTVPKKVQTSTPVVAAAAKSAPPPTPLPPLLPIAAFYTTHIAPRASGDFWANCYAKFPAKSPALVAPAPASRPALVAPAPPLSFDRKPSVGTWLQLRPRVSATPTLAPPDHITAAWCLQGIRPPLSMSFDERCEVERVLTSVLDELTGEFAGEYFPLRTSTTYLPRPGGMSQDEARLLGTRGLLLQLPDAAGRGVFATAAGDAAVWVNGAQHVHFIVERKGKDPRDALTKLDHFEKAVREALLQHGYSF